MQTWNKVDYVDGGVIYMNDIGEAVERCYEVTGDYSKIIVDMLQCFRADLNGTKSDLKTLEVRSRVNEIKSFDKSMANLAWAITAFPQVNFRYYVQPSVSLGLIPLDFSHQALENNYNIGFKDAQNVVNKNIYARQIIDEWIASNNGIIPIGKPIIIED